MILAVVLAALMATALAAPALAARLGRNAGYPIAAAFLLIGTPLAMQAPHVLDGGTVSVSWTWMPSIGVSFHLHLDGLSLLFSTLILGVGALIMAYCPRYLGTSEQHQRLYLLLTLFAMSMLGLVLARDLVLLFLFWELTTLSSFLLIGGAGRTAVQPAARALVITASGGLALLAAAVLIAIEAGTTDMSVIMADPTVLTNSPYAPAIALLLILAAFTKSAQIPFHFWLPDAMVAITPVSAYLHAATLVKGGIYLLMRFSPTFADMTMWTAVLMTVGLATMIVAAAFALKQHDLKSLLAYSTVSQLGFIISLIGVGTPDALAAAALHTFAHAMFKATLFMLVGIIDREAGSRDIRELGGLRRVMPVTATLTGLASMSMAGIPPFIGFVSKEEAYKAVLETPGPGWVAWVAALATVFGAGLTFAYGFRIFYGAFAGPTTQRKLYEPSAAFLLPAAIPATLGLVFGLTVGVLNPLVNRTVEDTMLTQTDAGLSLWHGFGIPLALSGLTFATGLALFFGRYPVDRMLHRHRMPVTGADVFNHILAGATRLGNWIGRPARTPAIGGHLIWPLGAVLVLAGCGLALGADVADHPVDTTRPADWGVIGLLAVAILALCLTTTRITAIVLLGVVGFLVGIWFLLAGAPDLALTQLLVEILTVVVAVLVLRRLPDAFRRIRPTRTLITAGIAIVAGLLTGAATFLLTGRRERSAAADYLMHETDHESGGKNVVNSILVDFRGLDTFGEITVLAIAGLGLAALLTTTPRPPEEPLGSLPPPDRPGNMVIFRVAARIVVPITAVIALYLLLRGHYQPGGGFIGSLVAGVALAVHQMPRGASSPPPIHGIPLIKTGLALSVVVGAFGLLDGSFLRPLRDYVVLAGTEIGLTSSLVFDVGVFLIVFGMIAVAYERLGRGGTADTTASDVPAELAVPEREGSRT